MPGQVIGCGDIGPGHLRQCIDQLPAGLGLGDVTAIDQDVALLAECPAPSADDVGVALQQ